MVLANLIGNRMSIFIFMNLFLNLYITSELLYYAVKLFINFCEQLMSADTSDKILSSDWLVSLKIGSDWLVNLLK